jgi:hypothetical protein
VAKDVDKSPYLYKLEDLQGKRVPGVFYGFELHMALSPHSEEGRQQLHFVERILDRKTENGKKRLFVKWVGYPSRSYIDNTGKQFIHVRQLNMLSLQV